MVKLRSKRRLLWALAATVFLSAFVMHHFWSGHAAGNGGGVPCYYAGKDVKDWFRYSKGATDVTFVDMQTRTAFKSMGASAVPFLVKILERDDPWWVRYYWRQWPGLPAKIRRHLPMPRAPDERQTRAAALLAVIGPPAGSAVPGLIAAYNRSYSRLHHLSGWRQLNWTAQFTNSSAPAVGRGSSVSSANSSFAAINAYMSIGIYQTMFDQDLPRNELDALIAIGGERAEIVPMALCALRDHNGPWVPMPDSAPAIKLSEPLILIALDDPVPIVRATAAHWLGSLAPDHGEVIPALAKALKDADLSVRENALISLGKARVELDATVTAVAGSLNDKDEGIRWRAASVLPGYGPPAQAAIPALVAMLGRDPSNRLRGKAAITLGELGPKARAAIPALEEAVQDEYVNVRRAAVDSLKAIAAPDQPK